MNLKSKFLIKLNMCNLIDLFIQHTNVKTKNKKPIYLI